MNENLEQPERPEDTTSGEADQVAELEKQIARQNEALASAEARITELEESLTEAGERLARTNNELSLAVLGYQRMVSESNSEIPEDLIHGDSIEAIDESLERSRRLINRIREGLEAEIQTIRIPAGAPQRNAPDLSALSAREKIQYSIRSGGN